jgi:hypothetical protein
MNAVLNDSEIIVLIITKKNAVHEFLNPAWFNVFQNLLEFIIF